MSDSKAKVEQCGQTIKVAVPKTLDRYWVTEDTSDEDDDFDVTCNACQVREDKGGVTFLSVRHGSEHIQASIPFDVFHKHFKPFVQAMKAEQKKIEDAQIRKPQ